MEKNNATLGTIESMHRRKTGALIVASLTIGARAAGAARSELEKLSRYGEAVGLAFQIADDLLDRTEAGASKESARKEDKKATYPSIAGVEQAERRLRDLMNQAAKSLNPFGLKAEPLRAIALYIGERALGGGETVSLQGVQRIPNARRTRMPGRGLRMED
jgi:geranylgeranyl diphosphate synthase type II